MDYVQPVGEADPNASYKDRNTGAGQPGSRVPALAIEMPQREIRTVIAAAGLVPNKANPTQLNAAIDAKIAAAIGSGESPLDDLLAILRAKTLAFPEILTSDGKIPLSSPSAGTVRVPLGYSFRHRGIFDVTTIEQDFVTAANKTYHWRWNPDDGIELKDLADTAYNPGGALPETAPAFDTTYDDMLFARVVTDASNVATITSLVNKDRLAKSERTTGSFTDGGVGDRSMTTTLALNWARSPTIQSISGNVRSGAPSPTGAMDGAAAYLTSRSVNRYEATATVFTDWATGTTLGSLAGYIDYVMGA